MKLSRPEIKTLEHWLFNPEDEKKREEALIMLLKIHQAYIVKRSRKACKRREERAKG